MASRWSFIVCCVVCAACSESVSGEWSVDSVSLSSGTGSSLSGIDGAMIIERDGVTSFEVVLGDFEADYLEINVDGTATTGDDGAFSLDLTGFQEEPQNAIFVDLLLDCTSTETSAECSGTWQSVGLADQTFSAAMTAL